MIMYKLVIIFTSGDKEEHLFYHKADAKKKEKELVNRFQDQIDYSYVYETKEVMQVSRKEEV